MKLWHRLLLLTVVPLVLQGYVFAQLKQAQEELDRAYATERQHKDVRILVDKALKASLDALSDTANYRSSHNELKRTHALEHLQQLRKIRDSLKPFSKTSPHLLTVVQGLGEVEDELEAATNPNQAEFNIRDITQFKKLSKFGRKINAIIEYAQIKQDLQYKQMLVIVQDERRKFDEMMLNAYLLCGVISFAIAGYITYITLRQLKVLKQNSENLARGVPLSAPLKGSDELADVDRTFHLMAHSLNQLTERERAILKNSGEWIFSVDAKMRFSFVSEAVEKLLGISPEDLLGQHITNLLGEAANLIEKARSTSVDQVFETVVKGKDDKPRDVQVSAHWVDAEQSFFCVAHDIGFRKELERMKQNFIAMVSHDLRTPVSANLLTLDLLQSDPRVGTLTERGVTLVKRSISSNNRLMSMVNDLLELERLDGGQLALEAELVTFNDLVEESLPAVEMQAKEKNISIACDDSDSLVYCDSGRIVQVIVNLLGNAIKFSAKDKSVSVIFSEDASFSRISVKDEGPGIDSAELPHIFDRFKQVEESGAHKQGFGLGLEICKKLVELHDGEIFVTSEVGVGTTFEIRLPKMSVKCQ